MTRGCCTALAVDDRNATRNLADRVESIELALAGSNLGRCHEAAIFHDVTRGLYSERM